MAGIGKWGSVFSWPIIGIHAVLTQSGKLLTFGTNPDGTQGGSMVHDLWDPVTGEHKLIDHHHDTPTDIFCAAAVILPGTNTILIAGGDTRPLGTTPNNGVDDVNLYDDTTGMIMPAPDGTMNVARWYPTVVSLASGQVVVMGGIDANGRGQCTPEIYTPGEGWRLLTGAADPDIAAVNYYPKMWVGPSGEIFYFANGSGPDDRLDLMALDPAGDGSIRQVLQLPFYLDWMSPSIMYETGHVLINDWRTGLYTLDLTTATPTLTKVADLSQDRNYSNMTVLADGTVLINGGTGQDNLEAFADTTALLWNPAKPTVLTEVGEEAHARLYHSSTILLPDGTVLSLGGGSASNAEKNYLDGQIYTPGYLLNADGSPATRPVVTAAPTELKPGETFRLTVDDANAIAKLTFEKTGAVTHNLNMDARGTTLAFTRIDAHTLEVTLPADRTAITAGSWMLFAWNTAGAPSVAPIIAVEPTAMHYDGIGDLTADTFAIAPGVKSLGAVDWTATPTDRALLSEIDTVTGTVATRFAGAFTVEADGSYTFTVTANASTRLYIDGRPVLANAGDVSVSLNAGTHTAELRTFVSGAQTGAVDLDWSGPAFARRQLTFDGLGDNLLVNGSVERAANAAGLPGWTVGAVETHAAGDLGLAARAGNGFVEIDAVTGPLSQKVATIHGETYRLALDVAGNPGGVSSSKLEVVVNGVVIATIAPSDTAWHRYDLSFTGMGGDTVLLRSPAGDTDAVGALVDAVVLTGPRPVVVDCDCDIMGTDRDDMLMGTSAPEEIMGMGGDDHIHGLGGADVLEGGDGDDWLVGGFGNDVLNGEAGSDTADYSDLRIGLTLDLAVRSRQSVGNLGFDRLISIENVVGGSGNDTLSGNRAANHLHGGAGDDILSGGDGADVLMGGRGRDVLTGGAGRDQIVFDLGDSGPGPRRDLVTDFTRGEDKLGGVLDWSGFIGKRAFGGTTGEVRYEIAGSKTLVMLDADGDRRADLVVELSGAVPLVRGDFLRAPEMPDAHHGEAIVAFHPGGHAPSIDAFLTLCSV